MRRLRFLFQLHAPLNTLFPAAAAALANPNKQMLRLTAAWISGSG
jgi:hypothetical protein